MRSIHSIGLVGLLGLMLSALLPGSPSAKSDAPASSAGDAAAYASIKPVLEQRCLACHSAKPVLPQYRHPPAGVSLQTPEELRKFAPRVLALTFTTHRMPPQNITAMTGDERDKLASIIRRTFLSGR